MGLEDVDRVPQRMGNPGMMARLAKSRLVENAGKRRLGFRLDAGMIPNLCMPNGS
jgi:hypothetical protein